MALNNANIDTTGTAVDVSTNKINLEINLTGTNRMVSDTFYETILLARSNLIITGAGTLDVSNTTQGNGDVIKTNAGIVDGVRYGDISVVDVSNLKVYTSGSTAKAISCGGDLKIENSLVKASNTAEYNRTISVLGNSLISNSNIDVSAKGTGAVGLYSEGLSEITNATVKVRSKAASISTKNISISNSNVDAISTENNAIYATGFLSIKDKSDITVEGYYCGLQARGVDGLNIDGSTVVANSTADLGVWSNTSLAITNDSNVTVTGVKGSIGGKTSTTIAPATDQSVDVLVGENKSSATLLNGAPFSTQTDLDALNVSSNLYFHSKTHSHVASTTWSKDVTSHWHECTANDGEKMDVASHTFGDWVIDTPATETTKGSKHRDCTVCGQREMVEIPSPVITAGAGSTYQISNGKDMTVTCTGALEDLTGIYIDGKSVDKNNYTLETGSTILKLKSSYLDTLSTGKHTLKFQYKDNASAETEFTITAKAGVTPEKPGVTPTKPGVTPTKPATPNAPKTSDTSNTMLYLGLIVLSGCVAGFGLKKKKYLSK